MASTTTRTSVMHGGGAAAPTEAWRPGRGREEGRHGDSKGRRSPSGFLAICVIVHVTVQDTQDFKFCTALRWVLWYVSPQMGAEQQGGP